MHKLYITMAILCIFSNIGYSHPHIFIDNSIEIVLDTCSVSCIDVSWEFDEMFSQSLITDYDLNKDRSFNKDEIEELRKGAFENLENYEYFAHIRINNKKQSVEVMENFSASIDGNKVSYMFSIPCNTNINNQETELRISFYDDSYFCDLAPISEDSVIINCSDKICYTTSIVNDESSAFYFGQIVPREVVVKMRLKNEN